MSQEATIVKVMSQNATHTIHTSFTVYSDGDYRIDSITLEDSQMDTERGPVIGRSFNKPDNLKNIKKSRLLDIKEAIEDYIGFNGLASPRYGFSGMRGF